MVRVLFPVAIAALSLVSFSPALAAVVIEVEANDSLATAQNIDPHFTLDYSDDIGDTSTNTSTTIPHVTIIGTGNDTFDWYQFTVAAPGRGIFEIDYGMPDLDAWLTLYDAAGGFLFDNDDSSAAIGAGGSVHHYDSYIEYIFSLPGTYYIEVAAFPHVPVYSGTDYQLQVSIEGHHLIPEAASIATWALILGCLGGIRRIWRTPSHFRASNS
jgi:hypothetical protein